MTDFRLPSWVLPLAQKIQQYSLSGIRIMPPGEVLAPTGWAERENGPVERIRYPVSTCWQTKPSSEEVGELRSLFGLRDDVSTATCLLGSRGPHDDFRTCLKEIVSGYARELFDANLLSPPAIDLVVICGHSEELRSELSALAKAPQSLLPEGFAETGELASLGDLLRVVPLGYTQNYQISTLVQMSDLVITKPGGTTTAELLAAGTAKPLVLSPLRWERQNVEVLRGTLGGQLLRSPEGPYAVFRDRLKWDASDISMPVSPFPTAEDAVRRLLPVERREGEGRPVTKDF